MYRGNAPAPDAGWRSKLHEVIFEADTPAGKAFDILLIICIICSVLAVVLESVDSIRLKHGPLLIRAEWFFTVLFTIEYVLRLLSVRRPLGYARSFFGVVDFLSIIPTYIAIFVPGGQTLLTIRGLRLLRIFRVFKLTAYVGEATDLARALRASLRKIMVFLFAVFTIAIIIGSFMHIVEGDESGFTDIPTSVYWAIVTLTTVGYGDITPATALGKTLSCFVMICGFGIIAVPTGIVSVEISRLTKEQTGVSCKACSKQGHATDATFCKFCGDKL